MLRVSTARRRSSSSVLCCSASWRSCPPPSSLSPGAAWLGGREQRVAGAYGCGRVRAGGGGSGGDGALLGPVYVDRAYKLADEDFAAGELLEKRIVDLTGDAPPSQDLRG